MCEACEETAGAPAEESNETAPNLFTAGQEFKVDEMAHDLDLTDLADTLTPTAEAREVMSEDYLRFLFGRENIELGESFRVRACNGGVYTLVGCSQVEETPVYVGILLVTDPDAEHPKGIPFAFTDPTDGDEPPFSAVAGTTVPAIVADDDDKEDGGADGGNGDTTANDSAAVAEGGGDGAGGPGGQFSLW